MKKLRPIKLNEYTENLYIKIYQGCYINLDHRNKNGTKLSFNRPKIKNICQAVLLFSKGMNVDEIANIMQLEKRTIYNYIETYRKDSSFLKKIPVTNVSDLQAYVNLIADDFKHTKVKTYKEAQQRIEELTGIHRGITQIRAFLMNNYFEKNSKGYFYQKTSKLIRLQLKERNKKFESKNQLDIKFKEIEDYVYKIAIACNYEPSFVAERVKEHFDLKESNEVIEKWIETNTSL